MAADAPGGVEITRGTRADARALARFHYRPGACAPPVLVLAARDRGRLAGVLAVSMPVLNGPWRERLWPGAMGPGSDKRRATDALNAHVRTIARVIVEPRWRARGVGSALVRAYLAAPLTRFTEAVASAAVWSPLFARAGMDAVELAAGKRERRLGRELRRLGVRARDLIDASRAERLMRRAAVRSAVERWARDGRSTRRLIGIAAGWELAARAASSLLARPVAYGFDRDRATAK